MNLTLRRRAFDAGFKALCMVVSVGATVVLLVLLGKVFADGISHLSLGFLTSRPSILFAKKAGIAYAALGSLWIMFLTVTFTVPVGVGAAIYLEEFNTRKTRLSEFIQLNIANLAGVPSVVFGMLGLGIFIGIIGLGKNILAGALTMAILVMPVVIMVSQEALKAVPRNYREGSQALGASKWESIRTVVLPTALPGIMTGVILAAARAIGETAPLIVVGAVGLTTSPPRDWNSRYTVMPLQILDWIQSSRTDFHPLAATAIIVLMSALLILNSLAIIIRSRSRKKF